MLFLRSDLFGRSMLPRSREQMHAWRPLAKIPAKEKQRHTFSASYCRSIVRWRMLDVTANEWLWLLPPMSLPLLLIERRMVAQLIKHWKEKRNSSAEIPTSCRGKIKYHFLNVERGKEERKRYASSSLLYVATACIIRSTVHSFRCHFAFVGWRMSNYKLCAVI